MEAFFLTLCGIIVFAGQLLGIWCLIEPRIKEKKRHSPYFKIVRRL